MQEAIFVTGIVLKYSPVGEYDRLVTLLTKERGKINAFARGVRKPTSKMGAATNSLSFGKFKLHEGKNAYSLVDAEIQNFFEELRIDYLGACYGQYFSEVAGYYAQENNDETELLKLLYQSLRALGKDTLDNSLIRSVFELRAIQINGEYPGAPTDRTLEESTIYALNHIVSSPIERLYTFTVNEKVLTELKQVAELYMKRYVGHNFKSLEVLKTLG